MSECSNLSQKEYKTRHKWIGKVIHWELCKKLKLDYAKMSNMYNLEYVLNETHKVLLGFDIQTDPEIVYKNKKRKWERAK